MVRALEKAYTSHFISSCLSAAREWKRWQGLSPLAAIIYCGRKSAFVTPYTLQGRKDVEMIRVILFSSADLREVRHKGPRGYRYYGTSHCQSSQSIPLPQLLPPLGLYSSLLWLMRASKLPTATCCDSQRPLLLKQHTINTTVNFYTVFKKALYEVRQLLVCWCSAWGTKAGMGEEELSEVPPNESRTWHLRNDWVAA